MYRTEKKPAWWKVVHSVQYFCYSLWISQKIKEIRLEGAADGKTPSYLQRYKHWVSSAHSHEHWSTQARHKHRYTQDFQFAIRPSAVNSPCSPPLSFVFGIKVPPCHKSQILYDIVEIALSKMQSAKAASSADELLGLRKRQWLVSFALSGSIEDKHLEDLNESQRILQIWMDPSKSS